MQSRLVGAAEAAKTMGISRQTFYNRMKLGQVPDRVCERPQRWLEADLRLYNEGGYRFAHDQWVRKCEFIAKTAEWLEFVIDTKVRREMPDRSDADAWTEAAEDVAPELVALAIAGKAALDNSFTPVPVRHELAKNMINFNFDRGMADMSPNELKTIRATTDALKKMT